MRIKERRTATATSGGKSGIALASSFFPLDVIAIPTKNSSSCKCIWDNGAQSITNNNAYLNDRRDNARSYRCRGGNCGGSASASVESEGGGGNGCRRVVLKEGIAVDM